MTPADVSSLTEAIRDSSQKTSPPAYRRLERHRRSAAMSCIMLCGGEISGGDVPSTQIVTPDARRSIATVSGEQNGDCPEHVAT